MNSSDDPRRVKRELRARVRAARDAIPAEQREVLGAKIAERLFAVPGFARAGTVLAFSSFGSEVPTRPILDRVHGDGRRVVLPRVLGDVMEARTYRPGDPMAAATFGALEPADGEQVPPRTSTPSSFPAWPSIAAASAWATAGVTSTGSLSSCGPTL